MHSIDRIATSAAEHLFFYFLFEGSASTYLMFSSLSSLQ